MTEQWKQAMQRKLDGYAQPAPELPWAEWEQTLVGSRRRRVLPLWHRWAAAVALLLLAVGTGYLLWSPSGDDETAPPSLPPVSTVVPKGDESSVFTIAPKGGESVALGQPVLSPQTPRQTRFLTLESTEEPTDTATDCPPPFVAENTERSVAEPVEKVEPDNPPSPSSQREAVPRNRTIYSRNLQRLRVRRPLLAQAWASRGRHTSLSLGDALDANYASPFNFQLHHRQPLRFGFALSYQVAKRWSLDMGLSYTLLTAAGSVSFNQDGQPLVVHANQRLSYVGIPLGASYRIWDGRRVGFYASAGILADKMVRGRRTYQGNNLPVEIPTEESLRIRPLQWSVNAAVGMDVKLYRGLRLYAEPGVGYYFDNHSQVPTLYQDDPLTLNLNVGLRFNLK